MLTKGGKRYFMTSIDDVSRFCYVYLLRTKDEALDYFKSIRLKFKINWRERSNVLGRIVVASISPMYLMSFVRNMVLFMRERLPTLPNQTGSPRGKAVR